MTPSVVKGSRTLMVDARYDSIGAKYAATRREDPRIAALIHAALGQARTIVNVGAGAGSYEPRTPAHTTSPRKSPQHSEVSPPITERTTSPRRVRE
jgi:hypothetical protein